ncbi:MAG: sigma 54-interacting transcriptional regulator [Deltaproteobacteria bacterium]|nr:sigma 54-interacting transcriptional regulator [Deltaproteobacteria bacterium]
MILPDLLGASESLLRVKERLSQAAKVNRPVMILGERGTGKELAAARLHYLSRRWQGPYVALNCAALAPSLLDAELFGHEAGAFTGAARRRPGRFEAADGGTLFLDEISHLSLAAQARILRVVEYGVFQLVGGAAERRVDVRVVAATNADLRRRRQAGLFLEDLWDRLSFEVLTLPPLRERPGDVTLLAHSFGARMAQELGLAGVPVFSPEALARLEAHSWPGNVRELKNAVERAVWRSAEDPRPLLGPELFQLEEALGGRPLTGSPGRSRPGEPDWLGEPAPPECGPSECGPTAGGPDDELAQPPSQGGAAEELSEDGRPDRRSCGPRPARPGPDEPLPLAPGDFDRLLAQKARRLLERALEQARFNQRKAAALLGLSYDRFRALRRKLADPAG